MKTNIISNGVLYRFWSREIGDRSWHPMVDTPEERQKAIQSMAMFFSIPLFDQLPEEGGAEPTRFGPMVLDFDCKSDPAEAFREARYLVAHLSDHYSLDANAIDLFASGGKGCHMIVPPECFGTESGDSLLPLIYKWLASEWKEDLSLKTLDLSLFCMGKGKMVRFENIRRENGRFKIPLTLHEFTSLPIDEINKLTLNPRTIEAPDGADYSCPDLAADFRAKLEQIHAEEAEIKNIPPPDPEMTAKISGQIAPCISYVLSAKPKTQNTTFNKLVMALVAYFQVAGFTLDQALDVAGRFLSSYSHSTAYTTPEARLKEFRSKWTYVQGHETYSFRCALILGMGFPGNAFDCRECPMKAAPTERETIKFEDLSNWQLLPPPQIEYIYKKMLVRQVVGVICAQGGTGKSYFLQALAMASILGRDCFSLFFPEKPLRVMGFFVEDPAIITRTRMYDIGSTFVGNGGLARSDLQTAMNDNLKLFCDALGPLAHYDGKNNPESTDAFKWLSDQVCKFNPDLIILDPKAQLYGLDENNNDHNTWWVNLIKQLNSDGASTLFAHHTPKNVSAFSLNGLRGGGGLGDACRWAMGMQHLDADTAKMLEITEPAGYVHAKMTKNSYAPLKTDDIFFERGDGGELYRVDLKSNQVDGLEGMMLSEIRDHYTNGCEALTVRDIIKESKGKEIRASLKEHFPKATREKLETVIQKLLLVKQLELIDVQRGKKTIQSISPKLEISDDPDCRTDLDENVCPDSSD